MRPDSTDTRVPLPHPGNYQHMPDGMRAYIVEAAGREPLREAREEDEYASTVEGKHGQDARKEQLALGARRKGAPMA